MGCMTLFCEGVFEYDTTKLVHIKNKKIGLVFRFFQLLIIGYILGYVIIFKKGYQNTTDVLSSVTTKVKGVVYTGNYSDAQFHPAINDTSIYKRLWDVTDYVIPASENNAFFIATNFIITHQTQGKCPEDPDVPGALCEFDENCTEGIPLPTGNGVMTGKCVPSDYWGYEKNFTCEIIGWCKVEQDFGPLNYSEALLVETKKATVLIKNYVLFTEYKQGLRRRNIADSANTTYLNGCHYNAKTDPQCPVFVLEDIVRGAGEDYAVMAIKGGVMSVIISWNCDFDTSEDGCIPTYSFKRMDNPNVNIAKGWNFRYSNVFEDHSRTLYKTYGIDFVVLVNGKGGWFHVVPLLLNIGSGLGLLAIATVIADIFVLYVVQKRELYKEKKYLQVGTEDDGFQNLLPNSFRRKNVSSPTPVEGTSSGGNFNYGIIPD